MLFYKRAAGKSPNTIDSYRFLLDKLKLYFRDDPPFASITRDQLVRFLAWLRDDYKPEPSNGRGRHVDKLSPKTILDIYGTASALWGWAVEEELAEKNLIRTIAAPKATDPVIETFTKEQLEAMLKACDRTGIWKSRELTTNARPTADRDRAIILLLTDTGMRATELCDIQMKDVNLNNHSIKIVGKGNKERIVFFGKRTGKALWKHLLPRLNAEQPQDHLFMVDYPRDPRKMQRGVLMHLLKRIGERAGVRGVHPHRYRHTFAITYLRNGGDVLTLQALLGHADLKMVKRYAQVAASDCARVHQAASPVDNWRL
jgi:integrase/recombinase XerD